MRDDKQTYRWGHTTPRRRLSLAALALLTAGCHWLSPYGEPTLGPATTSEAMVDQGAADQAPDITLPDVGAPDVGAPDVTPDLIAPDLTADAALCSAAGVDTSCNPLELTGCASGACYVIQQLKGPGCVCPVGDLPSDATCTTTSECLPGLVCVGTTPPGVCRRVCDPTVAWRPCPSRQACVPITVAPTWGYCTRY